MIFLGVWWFYRIFIDYFHDNKKLDKSYNGR